MTGPSISVVICAYSELRWASLVAGVTEVAQQLADRDELIVVIDHNEPMLARAEAAFSNAVVLANVQSSGLSGARNTGVSRASREIVVFLDDDALPEPGWLDGLRGGYGQPRVVGVGGVARPMWVGDTPRWFPDEFLWVVGCSYHGLPEKVGPVRNFIGANMSFRRSVFGAVGGFESRLGRVGTLPAGCEETELGIRISQVLPGSVLLHQPASVVQHLVPETRAQLGYYVRRCWSEGRSKAIVAGMVGSGDALSSERAYVTRILPAAVAAGARQALRGDASGIARAGAIILGLVVTTAGYAAALPTARRPHGASFAGMELARPRTTS